MKEEDSTNVPVKTEKGPPGRHLPVVSLAAEHLVIGELMRRNVLAYKAPPGFAGYDLICIHPDPKQSNLALRVQVKSRYQTDSNSAFTMKAKTLDSFDYAALVLLNIGNFYKKTDPGVLGRRESVIYFVPADWIREHHYDSASGFGKVSIKGHEAKLAKFKGQAGADLIADKLGVLFPSFPPRVKKPKKKKPKAAV